MRIGVDYRMLAIGRTLMKRGIPRFTQQQLRHVLHLDHENEYCVVHKQGDDVSLIDPEIRSAPNVRLHSFPHDPGTTGSGVLSSPRQAEEYLEFISKLQLDLYHAPAAFITATPVLDRFGVCPMVTTLYDVIPLIFPTHFFHSELMRDAYRRAANLHRMASRILSISSAAAADARIYLGLDPERIDVAYPIADPCFRPITPAAATPVLQRLRKRYGLRERYVLTVSWIAYSKNLRTLLAAYSRVPPAVRSRLSLVVTGITVESEIPPVLTLAERLGIRDDLVLLPLVSDQELAVLYNGADCVVCPSLYEGFGLPVLEAMQCGTPVIASSAGALSEVAGGAALVVDPNQPLAMTEAIMKLVTDSDLAADFGQRGLERARQFTGERLGRETLASYRRAIPSSTPEATFASPPARIDDRLPLSKLCDIADFSHRDLRSAMETMPNGHNSRTQWEKAMAVRALRHGRAEHPDAVTLTLEDDAVGDVLLPALDHDDESLDAVVCRGVLERLGGFLDVAGVAHEIGRVVKPGGVVSVTTKFLLAGPPGGLGWPGETLLFTEELIRRYIVEASGLELAEPFVTRPSTDTLRAPRDINHAVTPVSAPEVVRDLPEVVVVHDGYAFTSIHLLLRKTERFPEVPNYWARPTSAKMAGITDDDPKTTRVSPELAPGNALASLAAEVHSRLLNIDEHRYAMQRAASALRQMEGAAPRRRKGAVPPATHGGRGVRQVELASGLLGPVVIDSALDDPNVRDLAGGENPDRDACELLRALVHPGDVVLDLGARLGTFTLTAALHGCSVVAVEPDPVYASLVRASVARACVRGASVIEAATPDEVEQIGLRELLADLGHSRVDLIRIGAGGVRHAMLGAAMELAATVGSPPLLYQCDGQSLGLRGIRPADVVREVGLGGYRSYLVDPGRLLSWGPEDVQLRTVCDYLATTEQPGLPQWWVQDAMTVDERVSLAVDESHHPSPIHRAYVAEALCGETAELRSCPAVTEVLTALSNDPDAAVRNACAWWSKQRAMRSFRR